MIDSNKVQEIYSNLLIWCARRLSKPCLELFGDETDHIVFAIQQIEQLYTTLMKARDIISLSNIEELFKTAYDEAKANNNYFALDTLFSFKHGILTEVFNRFTPMLEDYLIPAPPEYVEKYTYKCDKFTYQPESIFTYRGTNWPVFYDVNSSQDYVRFVDHNGEEKIFSLIWDWDYPIDRYLELSDGDKEKIDIKEYDIQ